VPPLHLFQRQHLPILPLRLRRARRPHLLRQVLGAHLVGAARQHQRTLYLTGGNRTLAAEKLGISRATLHAKIKEYGLEHVGKDT